MRITRATARKMGLDVPGGGGLPTPHLSDTLLAQMRMTKLPEPVREFRFHHTRRWRFDLAYPDRMIAIECEGLVPPNDDADRTSRHTTNRGYEQDCEKYDAAVLAGWRLLRFTPSMIRSGKALTMIELALDVWPPLLKGDQ